MKSRPARIATQNVAGGEKTEEQLKKELRKTKEELAIQKWGMEKTLKGMKALVRGLAKELFRKKEVVAIQKWSLEKTLKGMKALVKELIQKKKEIKEAYERLEQTDKAKTEFVSIASHQLRTPLTSVKWYSEMLLGGDAGELNPKQKKYTGELYRGNERMIDLVRNLLNVSRIEMGVLAVNPKPTDIGELIKEIIKEQTSFIQGKKHEVVVEIPEGLPKIPTDPELVRMIFQNLFGNAVEYTPAEGKITCTVEKKDSEIIIGIKDTGIGIPEKQQNQIFQKLFRGDNAVREHSEGTGLELYITKAMVDALSGKIWFKSKESEGTTFWVALLLKRPKIRPGQKIIDNHNHYGQTK